MSKDDRHDCTNCRYCGGYNDEGYGVGEYICNHPKGDEIGDGDDGICIGWQKEIEKTVDIDGRQYTIKTPADCPDCPFLDWRDGYDMICTLAYRLMKVKITDSAIIGSDCCGFDAKFPDNCPLKNKEVEE